MARGVYALETGAGARPVSLKKRYQAALGALREAPAVLLGIPRHGLRPPPPVAQEHGWHFAQSDARRTPLVAMTTPERLALEGWEPEHAARVAGVRCQSRAQAAPIRTISNTHFTSR